MTTFIRWMRMQQQVQSSLSWSAANWMTGQPTMAQQIASWTIQNLRDKRGFFYYQRRRFYTVRKPYMRWTQAWMLYALARLARGTGVVKCQSHQT